MLFRSHKPLLSVAGFSTENGLTGFSTRGNANEYMVSDWEVVWGSDPQTAGPGVYDHFYWGEENVTVNNTTYSIGNSVIVEKPIGFRVRITKDGGDPSISPSLDAGAFKDEFNNENDFAEEDAQGTVFQIDFASPTTTTTTTRRPAY